MLLIYLYGVLYIAASVQSVRKPKKKLGWDDISLHCRDNDENPVDWWYMYKYPRKIVKYGCNVDVFNYLTSDGPAQWQEAHALITAYGIGRCMLSNTLNALFEWTYQPHLAAVTYVEKWEDDNEPTNKTSSSIGVLMADAMGGVWLSHTVPNLLPPKFASYFEFPGDQILHGHLFVCLSLSHRELNKVAAAVRRSQPHVLYSHFAPDIQWKVPGMLKLAANKPQATKPSSISMKNVITKKGAQFSLFSGPPKGITSLYKHFSDIQQIKIKVHHQSTVKTCKNRGRALGWIREEHSKWAIRAGESKGDDYWLCTSNLKESDTPSVGGLLLCANNKTVWWYMYKHPDELPIQLGGGLNYSYMTSLEVGRWKPSRLPITGRTMLADTIEPLFKKTYQEHLAAVIFTERASVSSSIGILLADEIGGAWISHTIPNFPNVSLSSYDFPPSQLSNGNLFVCLSLSHAELNKVAALIKRTNPKLIYTHFAENNRMKRLLPNLVDIRKRKESIVLEPDSHIETRLGTRFALLSSSPRNKTCLYRAFAEQRRLMLDVFCQAGGRKRKLASVCRKNFGIRHIPTYSLKYEESVFYIGTRRDNSKWAVSSANQMGSRSSQKDFWLCTSNIERTNDNPITAGLLLCINNADIWAAFDTLKISDPKCPRHDS